MKKYRQDLTHAAVAAVLAYDPLTGQLTHIKASARSPAGRPAGRLDTKGYYRTRLFGAEYKNHRLAWLLYYGAWPANEIDHINGNPADNRIENLRDATTFENSMNRQRPMKNNSTGYLGVCKARGGFIAQLKLGERKLRSTVQKTAGEAAAIYEQWKRTNCVA